MFWKQVLNPAEPSSVVLWESPDKGPGDIQKPQIWHAKLKLYFYLKIQPMNKKKKVLFL